MSRRNQSVCVAPVAIFYMSWFAVFMRACFACVPHWHIPTTTETHVPVVESFHRVLGIRRPSSPGISTSISSGISLGRSTSIRCVVPSSSSLASAASPSSSRLCVVPTLSSCLPSSACSRGGGGVDVGRWVQIGGWNRRGGVCWCLERWRRVLCGWCCILYGWWLWPPLCVVPIHSRWRSLSSHEVCELLLCRH